MSDESEFLKDVRDASLKTTVEHLRVLHRLQQGDSERRSGTEDHAAAGKKTDPSFPLGDFLFDLARLQLNAYNNLLNLSSKYTDQIIEHLRTSLQPLRPAVPPRRQTLTVRGSVGEALRAREPLTIDNQRTSAVEIALSISEFRPAAGGPYFAANVIFQAAPSTGNDAEDRRLKPGAQRDFVMTVKLDPPFQAGAHYLAELYAMLGERIEKVFDVQVEVEPSTDTASPASPPGHKTRGRRHGKR